MFKRSHSTPWMLLTLLSVMVLLGAAVERDTARAEEPTSEDIVKALKPKPHVPGVRTRSRRGVTVEPGAESKPPSIDLYINFKFDSAELEPDALLTLKALGKALRLPGAKGRSHPDHWSYRCERERCLQPKAFRAASKRGPKVARGDLRHRPGTPASIWARQVGTEGQEPTRGWHQSPCRDP